MANSLIDNRPLGYYVHHHGTGHMQRAIRICQHINRPIIMFSSLPEPTNLPAGVTYVQLISDVVPGYGQPTSSAFHYTPFSQSVFARNQQLIDTWRTHNIQELYVDVSIEVAVLAKLYGLTVGHALMLGDRTDAAHCYGYDAVDYLLAHYDLALDEPANHATQTPVQYSGGISRYQKRVPKRMTKIKTVVITISPKHETDINNNVFECAQNFPDITWHIVGHKLTSDLANVVSHGVMQNPQAVYAEADVIIGTGGTNTIMEAASFGKPFICIPEVRPFGEQAAAAKALQRLNAAVYLPEFPTANEWPVVVVQLSSLDLQVFSDLVDDQAASRAAAIIERSGQL